MARIIYMGTPDYARRILEAVWHPQHEWLIVTKPDMPVGRRQILTPSSVASWAQAQGLKVVKPRRLKDFEETWRAFTPDWILTAAYGRILPEWLLGLPRFGAYNLHASLLPRWRGANPIAWAIKSGDAETGVTLMAMDAGVDTGPIVAQAPVAILPTDTTGALTERLADRAAELWKSMTEGKDPGVLAAKPQPDQGATLAPKFDRHAGHLDWADPATRLDAWIRSMTPEPGAYTMLYDQRIKILLAHADAKRVVGSPGTARLDGDHWRVAAGDGSVVVRLIQPAGRRAMTPGDYVRGRRGEQEWALN
ncbi:MAG: methionyl-tRNA formyltransferase [Firmicutes bacterium]|nr:methionyl-tRNA formyltransferase [Bacillota bacterium]